MKIELVWVDVLLARWGRWSIRCESGALGFASSCILAGAGDGYGFDSAVPRGVLDDDMEAVDAAVRRLPIIFAACVIQVYQYGVGKSDRENAERLGITRKMLTQYINHVHQKIALDISLKEYQNPPQSVNGGNAPARIQPVTASA